MKNRTRLLTALLCTVMLFCGTRLFALTFPAGTTSHDCGVQSNNAITFAFTIPLGAGIGNVKAQFGFAAADTVPEALSGLTIQVLSSAQCPDCPCTFTKYYSSLDTTSQLRVNTGDDTKDYYARLTKTATVNRYQIEIVPYDLNTSPWTGSGTATWSVSLGITGGSSYHFSLFSIDTNLATEPADLAFTTINYCRPVAVVSPPQGSRFFINRGITVKGYARGLVPASLSAYQWNLYGGAFTGTGSLTSADPGSPVSFAVRGAQQLGLTITDTNGVASEESVKNLTLYDPANAADILLLQQPLSLAFPKKAANPPDASNGVITGDAGWNFSRKIEYLDGTTPYLTMRYLVLDDGTDKDLYLSFEVSDNSTAKDDYIILGFRPDSSALNADRQNDRIIIFNTFDDSFTILGNSAGWTTTGYSLANPVKKTVYGTGKWTAELKIPLKNTATSGGTGWINVTDGFLFYINVIRTQAGPTTDQLSWPRLATGAPLNPVTGVIAEFPYSPAEWGRATSSTTTSGGGVYLNGNDTGTTNADSSHIVFGAPNTFFADVRNNTTMDTVAVPVSGITAQIRIAQWGFGTGTTTIASWPDPVTIDANGVHNYTQSWTPTDTRYQTNCHQCIWVDLAGPADVYFTTPTRQKNMDFVSSATPDVHTCPPPPVPSGSPPPMDGNAVIGDEGEGDPPDGEEEQEIVVEVNTEEHTQVFGKFEDVTPAKLPPWARTYYEGVAAAFGQPAGTTWSYIKWIASGHVFTGEYITINGEKRKLYRPLGSFGYVMEHRGPVAGWREGITGDAVERIGPSTYRIRLPKDSRTGVKVEIKPIPLNGWSASLHAGLGAPLGALASIAGLGGTVAVDCGYQLGPYLALVAQAGFTYFFPQASGPAASWVLTVSPDLRYLAIPQGAVRPYVGAGPSLLWRSDGTFDYGANACAGVDLTIAPRLDLEVGALYHYLLPSNAQLLQLMVGAVWKFSAR
jgi:hypothetical protein